MKEVVPRKESATWSSAPFTARESPWFKKLELQSVTNFSSNERETNRLRFSFEKKLKVSVVSGISGVTVVIWGGLSGTQDLPSVDPPGGLCGEGCVGDVTCEDWSDWADCSNSCGNGTSNRERHITVPSRVLKIRCFTALHKNALHVSPKRGLAVVFHSLLHRNIILKCTELHQRFKVERYGQTEIHWNHSEMDFHNVPCNFQPVMQIEADYGGSLCTGDSKASRGSMLTHGMHLYLFSKLLLDTSWETRQVERPAISGCFLKPCPINCQWTDWSAWTDCSSSCGTGQQSRSRSVAVQPQFEGTLCEARRELERVENWEECSWTQIDYLFT